MSQPARSENQENFTGGCLDVVQQVEEARCKRRADFGLKWRAVAEHLRRTGDLKGTVDFARAMGRAQ